MNDKDQSSEINLNFLQKALDSIIKSHPQQDKSKNNPQNKKLWPIIFTPFEDESFSSWFTRISFANVSTPTQRVEQFEIKPINYDYDVEIKDDIFLKINSKTNLDVESLKKHTFYHENQQFNSLLLEQQNIVKIFKALCFTSWNERGQNNMRYCPECLKHDITPYFRKQWRYQFYTFCPIHLCLLESKCPNCNSPVLFHKLTWKSKLHYCYQCHFDLSETKPIKIIRMDLDHIHYQDFLLSQPYSYKQIYLLVTLAWFIANFCDITDPIFKAHPFSHQQTNVKFWHLFGRGVAKLRVFSNIELSYLFFHTAIRFFHNEEFWFKFFKQYYIESRLWSNSGFFPCPIDHCDFETENFSHFLAHFQGHYPNAYALDLHKKQKMPPKKLQFMNLLTFISENFYVCSQCEKSFQFETEYRAHLTRHSRSNLIQCKHCKTTFMNHYDLDKHMKNHLDLFKFACEICGRGFLSKMGLRKHCKSAHPKRS